MSVEFPFDRILTPDRVVERRVEDATVLLNVETGRYFTLDDVGTRVWRLLSETGSMRAAYQALLEEFAANPEQVHGDLVGLAKDLEAAGLLEVAHE